MTGFVARRIGIAFVILFGVSLVTFSAASLAPGDPVTAFIKPGSDLRPTNIEALRESLGLNKSWPERYQAWLGRLVTLDLGYTTSRQSVGALIAARLPNTIKLMGLALVISISLGVVLGVYSAFHQGGKIDSAMTSVVLVGISLPSYLLALLAVYLFAIQLKNLTGIAFFPTGGSQDPNSDLPRWADEIRHLILPSLVLAFGLTATFMRYTRAGVLEVMSQDHVTTARSKGLPERSVRFHHILRNALLPVITIIGLVLPGLVTGALFVETLFSYPGIGSLAIDATTNHDYNVIMAIAMLGAVAIIICNLLVDIVYGIVDPRIRYA